MDANQKESGPLSVELKLRQAIDALVAVAVMQPLGQRFEYEGMAAALLLSWTAHRGGLNEMLAEFRHVRPLLGSAGDWDKDMRGCIMTLELAYNAALAHGEELSGKACVVKHNATGLVLVAVFNELADDCGMAHMRWMSAAHAVPRPRAECETLAAAWNVLCGRQVAEVVEV